MKAKFITEGKKIYFQDRNGAKWNEECIADLFAMVHAFNKFFEGVRYYCSERQDDEDFYDK